MFDRKIELFLQACAGVSHAHEHDVIHCDLKPSNILVNGEGQVKVIDFGVARSMQLDDTSGASWSDASLIFGTPQYMSPEQARGLDFELDQRTDVYGLGVILYELLCGRLPYHVDRTTAITAARSILESEPVPPRKFGPVFRGGLENILLKALAKDVDHRYSTVATLEDDLRRLLRGEPVSPDRRRLSAFARRNERWIARHRLFAVAATIVLATALGAWVGGLIAKAGFSYAFDLFLTQHVHHVRSAPLRHVTIIKINEGTDIAALAGTRPTDQPGAATNHLFGRRAHGEFLKCLSRAGVQPRAIAFDITFRPATPFWDADFVAGIQSLRGLPVVVVAQGTHLFPSAPDVAPALLPLVFTGGTASLMRNDTAWTTLLATTLQNGAIYPSLGLLAASQCWERGQVPSIEWTPDSLRLRYANAVEREIDVTSVTETPDQNLELGLRPGTAVAEFIVEIPSDEHLEQSSLNYSEVFSLSDAKLRERLDGKVLLIGDYRKGIDGPFPHPDNRKLRGSVLQAVTIERLLSGDVLKRPRFISALAHVTVAAFIVLLASIAGGMIACWFKRRHVTRATVYAAAGIAIVVLTLLSFRFGGFIYSPLSPLLCLLIGGELVALICRARESTV